MSSNSDDNSMPIDPPMVVTIISGRVHDCSPVNQSAGRRRRTNAEGETTRASSPDFTQVERVLWYMVVPMVRSENELFHDYW